MEEYSVAVDILKCHLGMSLVEAHEELGLTESHQINECEME